MSYTNIERSRISDALEDKLERLERENEQLRAENAKHKETEQELMDALGPYALASWIHPSVHANAVAVHRKHFESMT